MAALVFVELILRVAVVVVTCDSISHDLELSWCTKLTVCSNQSGVLRIAPKIARHAYSSPALPFACSHLRTRSTAQCLNLVTTTCMWTLYSRNLATGPGFVKKSWQTLPTNRIEFGQSIIMANYVPTEAPVTRVTGFRLGKRLCVLIAILFRKSGRYSVTHANSHLCHWFSRLAPIPMLQRTKSLLLVCCSSSWSTAAIILADISQE